MEPARNRTPPACNLPASSAKRAAIFVNRIQAEFNVTDSGGIELLSQCCEASDLVARLSEQIAHDGLTIGGRQGLRSHPLLREQTSLRAFIVRILGKLGVTEEQIKPMGRPPKLNYWRGYDAE